MTLSGYYSSQDKRGNVVRAKDTLNCLGFKDLFIKIRTKQSSNAPLSLVRIFFMNKSLVKNQSKITMVFPILSSILRSLL